MKENVYIRDYVLFFSGYIRDVTQSYQVVLVCIVALNATGLLCYAISMVVRRRLRSAKGKDVQWDFVTKL